MLVLSRKAGESLRIDDDIIITVTRVQGNRVKIGIQAPPEKSIRRGEIDDTAQRPKPAEALATC